MLSKYDVFFIRALRDKADTLPKVQLSSVQLTLIKINILRSYIDLVKEVEKNVKGILLSSVFNANALDGVNYLYVSS